MVPTVGKRENVRLNLFDLFLRENALSFGDALREKVRNVFSDRTANSRVLLLVQKTFCRKSLYFEQVAVTCAAGCVP